MLVLNSSLFSKAKDFTNDDNSNNNNNNDKNNNKTTVSVKQLYTAAMYVTILVNIVTDLLKQSRGRKGTNTLNFGQWYLVKGNANLKDLQDVTLSYVVLCSALSKFFFRR